MKKARGQQLRHSLILSTLALFVGCGGGSGGSSDGGNTDAGGDNGSGSDSGGGSSDLRIPAEIDEQSFSASHMVDLNNDGELDIVLGLAGGEHPGDSILFNEGSGEFRLSTDALPERYLQAQGQTVAITSADVTGNGFQDLIAVAVDARRDSFYQSARLHVFHNNGDESFADATDEVYSGHIESGWPEWVRTADFDGDGYTDFLITAPGCAQEACFGGRIYLNNQQGGFAPATITMVDTYGEYRDSVLTWDGGQNTGERLDRNFRAALDLFVGDMDGDDRPDVFTGGTWSTWATFINDSEPGSLRFNVVFSGGTRTTGTPEGCESEFDPDGEPCGLLDPFTSETLFKNGTLLDVDNDGDLDVVASLAISGGNTTRAPISVLLNDGTGHVEYAGVAGTLSPERESASEPFDATEFPEDTGVVHARQWQVADFDGDGRDDLFIADHGYEGGGAGDFEGASNLLLLNQGDGTLRDVSAQWLSTAGTYTHGAAVGDVTGNGRPDIFKNNFRNLEDTVEATGQLLHLNNGDAPLDPVE